MVLTNLEAVRCLESLEVMAVPAMSRFLLALDYSFSPHLVQDTRLCVNARNNVIVEMHGRASLHLLYDIHFRFYLNS